MCSWHNLDVPNIKIRYQNNLRKKVISGTKIQRIIIVLNWNSLAIIKLEFLLQILLILRGIHIIAFLKISDLISFVINFLFFFRWLKYIHQQNILILKQELEATRNIELERYKYKFWNILKIKTYLSLICFGASLKTRFGLLVHNKIIILPTFNKSTDS